MAAVVTVQHDGYVDGLGKASQVGMYFLRRVKIDGNASVTTYTLTPTDLSATRIVRVMSIVPQANDTVYLSTPPVDSVGSSCVFTWTTNTTVFEAFVLCAGM